MLIPQLIGIDLEDIALAEDKLNAIFDVGDRSILELTTPYPQPLALMRVGHTQYLLQIGWTVIRFSVEGGVLHATYATEHEVISEDLHDFADDEDDDEEDDGEELLGGSA